MIGKNILPVEIYEQILETPAKRHLSLEMTSCSIYERLNRLLEIEYMRQAAEINDKVLKEAAKQVKVGMTEIQVAGLAEGMAREMNADIGSCYV